MTADAILARLVEISRHIESHKAAQFILEQERVELYGQLRASGWTPPEVPA